MEVLLQTRHRGSDGTYNTDNKKPVRLTAQLTAWTSVFLLEVSGPAIVENNVNLQL